MSQDPRPDDLAADEQSEVKRLHEERESRYRRFVENISSDYVFYAHDPDGLLTYLSPSIEKVLGFDPESMIGLNWRDFVNEDFSGREEADRAETEVAEGSLFHQFTVEIKHADGGTRLADIQQRPFFGPDGEYLSMEGIAKDITEAKRAADTIRKKETNLAHVSRLATMGELVAGIAHEVHQPLHAAKTFAEAARRNLEAGLPDGISTAIDCTKEISEAINRTAKIIRHLRAFTASKLESFEQLDLREVVQGAAEIIAYETRRAGVKVRFELASKLLPVQGDRVQLEQVCVNLLINAYEAMAETPGDQREVFVAARNDDQEVAISFHDRGCGVNPGDQDKMFDAFHSTKPNGMGMGLSLCKSIVETHAGRIWGEPNEGLGMTFTFSLPLSKSTSKKSLP